MRIKKTSQYIEGGTGLPSYFTTETDTGMKWIDGKTIYRKVYNGTSINSGGEVTLDTLSSSIKPVRLEGYLYRSDTQFFERIAEYYNMTTNDTARLFVDSSGNLKVQTGSNYNSNCKIIIIIEYTKSS